MHVAVLVVSCVCYVRQTVDESNTHSVDVNVG